MINSVFYTFRAIEGQEWNKTIYTASISFIQIADLCKVDPDAQRQPDQNRMESICQYILDGFTGERFMTGFNAIVTSLRNSSLEYTTENCEVKISTRGKLYITDGMHRCGGIKLCVEKVEAELEKARNNEDKNALEYWSSILKKLEDTNLPVIIFTKLTKSDERQLFHDLNNLGASVAQSQALSFDQTDRFNRISKNLELKIPQLNKYGLNKTAKTLSDTNKQVATLGIWNNCNKILLNGSTDKEIKQAWNKSWNYQEKEDLCKEFWYTFFNILPPDFTDKEKYIISRSAYLQGVAAFGHKLIFEYKLPDWKNKVIKLQNFDWSNTNNVYSQYGGGSLGLKLDKKTGTQVSKFYFKGTRAAINSVSQALYEYIAI